MVFLLNYSFFCLDLNKYTEYTVEVSASTRMGEGVRSSPLHILTDEDGKSEQKFQCIIFYLLY